MNIFKFRVIIDTEKDVFRDIEIATENTFLDLHKSILKAFDWEEGEMASFYKSNDTWERGTEVPLMDMGSMSDDPDEEAIIPAGSMSNTKLNQLVNKPDEKLVYVYDFMRMWCFYIELQSVSKAAPAILYPRVTMIFGDAPTLESKEFDLFGDFDQPEKDEVELTGDPEIDEFLLGDDGDDDESQYTSLDDLDI